MSPITVIIVVEVVGVRPRGHTSGVPPVSKELIEASLFDAVIVFGCVIRGGTPHFDYVCQSHPHVLYLRELPCRCSPF